MRYVRELQKQRALIFGQADSKQRKCQKETSPGDVFE